MFSRCRCDRALPADPGLVASCRGRARFQEFTMTDKPKKLPETARTLLTAAAARDNHLIRPPNLPVAAARWVAQLLLNVGCAEEVPRSIEDIDYIWRRSEAGIDLGFCATTLGLHSISEGDGMAR